jgi:FAD/FMN-containing dehydrogenase
VTEEDVKIFRSILERHDDERGDNRDSSTSGASAHGPEKQVKKEGRRGRLIYNDPDLLEPFNRDFTSHYRGSADVVLLPASTRQVSDIVRHCHQRRLPIIPQGGNTGLVGGGVGGPGVILSTRNMDQVVSFDADEGVLNCQAGCVLQNLQQSAASHGWLVPLDLGAKGSCQMGGNLSTNAGGVYYYRYGSLAANLLGLEVVIPDDAGSVLRLGSAMRKDNTGYKLQNLFLGAEGTLGIVTGATLQCHPLPKSQSAVWLVCPDFAGVLRVRHIARQILGETLAAMEWMDGTIANMASKHIPWKARSLDFLASSVGPEERDRHHVLVETHGSNSAHDEQKMTAFLERVLDEQYATDGVLAQSLDQRESFWTIRESCNPAMASKGYTYKYDVSIPVASFAAFLRDIRDGLTRFETTTRDDMVVASWGHIMDGNMHLNVHRRNVHDPDPILSNFLDDLVFEQVTKLRGSISAEHGIGVAKKRYLSRVHDLATLRTMRSVKHLLDPHHILNPEKLF